MLFRWCLYAGGEKTICSELLLISSKTNWIDIVLSKCLFSKCNENCSEYDSCYAVSYGLIYFNINQCGKSGIRPRWDLWAIILVVFSYLKPNWKLEKKLSFWWMRCRNSKIKLTTWKVFYFYSALVGTNAGLLAHHPSIIIVILATIAPRSFWFTVFIWSDRSQHLTSDPKLPVNKCNISTNGIKSMLH